MENTLKYLGHNTCTKKCEVLHLDLPLSLSWNFAKGVHPIYCIVWAFTYPPHYRHGVGRVRGGEGNPVQLPGVSLIPRPLEKWPGNCYVWDQTVYECSVTIPWSHSSSKYQISACESWFLQLMRTRLRARGSNSDTIAFIICHVMTFWIWLELPTFWWQK